MDRLRRGQARSGMTHAHLLGIEGGGMDGLAEMLVHRGVRVTGSAKETGPSVERLRRIGVRVHAKHVPGAGPKSAHFLVFDPGTPRDHPERLIAARRGIAQGSLPQWLGGLMREAQGVAVVGRRDASVAAAMIGWVLVQAGHDPSVLLGMSAPQLGGRGRLGSGAHFVVEAPPDPVAGFEPVAPRIAILLDVEVAEGTNPCSRAAALRRIVSSVPADGHVLVRGPGELAGSAIENLDAAVERISLDRGCAWWGADLREERGRYRFRAFHRGRFAIEVRLQVAGRRNVLCALAAVAACTRLGVPGRAIKQGLEEFTGVSRDFESRGSYRGVTLVDDEGCDPEAISETIALGRQVFGSRRTWAAWHEGRAGFGPHERARCRSAFAAADRVLIIGGESGGRCGEGAEPLARSLVEAGIQARGVANLEDAVCVLDQELEPGDVLVTLGAGEVGTIADAFIRRLSRDRQGR